MNVSSREKMKNPLKKQIAKAWFCCLFFFIPLFLFSCNGNAKRKESEKTLRVLSSIAPYKFFVERIAEPHIAVDLFVPEGANSHTFEPSPRQMIEASYCKIWFQAGDSYESPMKESLRHSNPDMQFVDLRKDIDQIFLKKSCCSHIEKHKKTLMDIHIWLSPKGAKEQAKTIASSLIKRFPEFEEEFKRKLHQFLLELECVDKEIAKLLANCRGKSIVTSHAAFGYFCRDYGLNQISIECEGKEPSTNYIAKTIKEIKKLNAKTIFLQKQHNNRGGKRIAEELQLKTVFLDPYSPNYFNNLRKIANAFKEECERSL